MEINQITVNGSSTLDFPFETVVVENGGFTYAKKKNQFVESEYLSGSIKTEVNAWGPIEKSYKLFCYTSEVAKLRAVKLWAKDTGTLISSDEPDVYYEILDVEIEDSKRDGKPYFILEITFTCQPFGFERTQSTRTYRTGDKITNHTNAPMYPLITVFGTSNTQTSIKIGNQTVYIAKLIDKLTIENKYLEQDVRDRNNAQANNVMRGDFFEIPAESVNTITLGNGIDRVEILERWGWL
ncbi:Phage-related protein [Aerococcus viridans]|nr:Phage-related protein [Aerococcus viridans]